MDCRHPFKRVHLRWVENKNYYKDLDWNVCPKFLTFFTFLFLLLLLLLLLLQGLVPSVVLCHANDQSSTDNSLYCHAVRKNVGGTWASDMPLLQVKTGQAEYHILKVVRLKEHFLLLYV